MAAAAAKTEDKKGAKDAPPEKKLPWPRRPGSPEVHNPHGTMAGTDERADLPKGSEKDPTMFAKPWGSEPRRSAYVEPPAPPKKAPASK